MKEILNKIAYNVLSALYQPFWTALLIAFLSMFVFLYAKEKNWKKKNIVYNRNLLGGLYRENPVKSRNYEAVKSSKKWENVGNSYIIPALLLYRYSYI